MLSACNNPDHKFRTGRKVDDPEVSPNDSGIVRHVEQASIQLRSHSQHLDEFRQSLHPSTARSP